MTNSTSNQVISLFWFTFLATLLIFYGLHNRNETSFNNSILLVLFNQGAFHIYAILMEEVRYKMEFQNKIIFN